jgi:hypothetical protein
MVGTGSSPTLLNSMTIELSESLKVAAQAAGIGGISLFIFLILFREFIRKNIFPTLTQAQSYRLITLFLVLTFTISLVGIAAWILSPQHPASSTPNPILGEWAVGGTSSNFKPSIFSFKSDGSVSAKWTLADAKPGISPVKAEVLGTYIQNGNEITIHWQNEREPETDIIQFISNSHMILNSPQGRILDLVKLSQ